DYPVQCGMRCLYFLFAPAPGVVFVQSRQGLSMRKRSRLFLLTLTLAAFSAALPVSGQLGGQPELPGTNTPRPAPFATNTPAQAAATQTPTPSLTPTATPPPSETPTPTFTPTTIGPSQYPDGINSLTGLPYPSVEAQERRNLLVKISNFPPMVRPQSG